MTPPWLDALTAPRSIALIGVSSDPTRVSGRALDFLLRYGYDGRIFPINLKADVVQGVTAYRSVRDVPEAPDLALISVQSAGVLKAVQDCGERGVRAVVVYASGFAEQDAEGARMQADLASAAREYGVRLLGPNCLGVVSPRHGLTATFATAFDEGSLEPGGIALLTHSGAFASFTYGLGRANGTRFGFMATTGNEADLTLAEILEAAIELPWIDSALLHVEGIRDPARFESALRRARELGKPIAVVKVGTTAVGARAAKAHTNSDVGDDGAFQQLFDTYGVVRVPTIEQLADAGRVFQTKRTVGSRRVTIVSISGGTGVLMADAAVSEGLEVPELTTDVQSKLAVHLPAFASTRNPVDVTGAILDRIDLFEQVLDICLQDEATDLVLVAVGNAAATQTLICRSILAAAAKSQKPVYVAWVGGDGAAVQRLNAAGVPAFNDPSRVVRAAALTPARPRARRLFASVD